MATFDDDLRLAHVLADAVERTALDGLGGPEGPGTPAEEVAATVEMLLRHQLQRTRPRDRVQGRHLEAIGHGDRRWVLDALDGAAGYARGIPVWATLVSLVVEDEPVLGLIAAPSLGRRWWAGQGSGTWTGRSLARARQVQVSRTTTLEAATMSLDDPGAWFSGPHGRGFYSLSRRVGRTRGYGDFWSFAMLADGGVDVALAVEADELQLATLAPIVREAGGALTDPYGVPVVGPGAPVSSAVVASNDRLHDAVRAELAPDAPLG